MEDALVALEIAEEAAASGCDIPVEMIEQTYCCS